MNNFKIVLTLIPFLLFNSGCQSLLPTQQIYTQTVYKSYTEVEDIVNKIDVGTTTYSDLVNLGLDLENIPNVKKLTYLDIMERFKLDSPSRYTLFNKIELPSGVLKTLDAKENGLAYEINLERIKNQREGSVILDALNFRKNVHTTGWKISVLILIVENKVEYVLYSGEKNIDTLKKEKNPLETPFQGFDGGDIIGVANDLDI